MIGQEISHYRIVEKIGEGGMGVVYRAEDLVLKRSVALKFLSNKALGNEEERERFLREAQAAAALDHPAICTVYEVSQSDDRTFLAMAYLPGETLRQRIEKQPLEVTEAVRVAAQVLEGLQEAHEERIVHRDIKSANIMITSKGRATIMDFGLAQLPGAARITQMGATLGTAAYMSPEQAEGRDVDHRTDLWSLGVVLYESLTGRFPFAGAYIPALMYAIVHEDPQPLDSVDDKYREELGEIMSKALTKSVDGRYQHASDMLADLNAFQQIHGLNLGSGKTTVIKPKAASAAPPVQPPVNQPPVQAESSPPETPAPTPQRSPWLWVAAGVVGASLVGGALWFTTQWPAGEPEPTATAAHVNPSPDAVPEERPPPEASSEPRATSPASNDQRGPREDASAASLPAAPPPPTDSSPESPTAQVPPRRPADSAPTAAVVARARQMIQSGGLRGIHGAVRLLQREVQTDPPSAEIHALLAKAHALEALLALADPSEVLSPAKESAETALSLDGSLADAHLAQAITLALNDRDWSGAEGSFARARAAAPRSADVHQYFALAFLAPQGRLDEALAEMKQAVTLNPSDREAQIWLGRTYSFRGEHDKAMAQYKQISGGASAPHSAALWGLGMAQAASGDLTAARDTFQQLTKASPGNTYAFAGTAYVEALSGGLSGSRVENRRALKGRMGNRLKGARKRSAGPRYVSPYWRAIVEAARGRKDAAFAQIKEGVEKRDPFVARAKVQPELTKLRSDRRFADLLKQMNLTP